MSPTLPTPLAAYFAAANAHDTDAVLACFAAAARVRDEGKDLVGREAIRAWSEHAQAMYRPTYAVTGLETAGGRTVVTAEVSGSFPGSPLALRHHFTLAGGKIAALEIRM